MNRIQWNVRTGLAGGFFLVADNCPYYISIYGTNRGERAQIMDHYMFKVGKELTINYAKRKVKHLIKGDLNEIH